MSNSWGNLPGYKEKDTSAPYWLNNKLLNKKTTIQGNARSYGDSCLSPSGNLLITKNLNKFISFNSETGELECESGVLIEDIINTFAPKGWFPIIVPGTKFVTIGGAIANDIHSKNHHKFGTFGNHVLSFELLKSDGKKYNCSNSENKELFKATIGGLGLTGLITKAKIKLKKIDNLYIDLETLQFKSLDQFTEINEQSKEYEYTVAWLDCMNKNRGIYIRGNHSTKKNNDLKLLKNKSLNFPFNLPNFTMNKVSMKVISSLYFNLNNNKKDTAKKSTTYFDSFFFPLDGILNWNRAYGKNGFYQFQCVVKKMKTIKKILNKINQPTFLSVLKTFGDIKSPGLLSFPMPGITLAVDFANNGEETLKQIKELEKITIEDSGKIYPAKDASMSKESFLASHPKIEEFEEYIDQNCKSKLWQRIRT